MVIQVTEKDVKSLNEKMKNLEAIKQQFINLQEEIDKKSQSD